MDISVVIPVKNGQKYLDAVLKAVFAQEIGASFEVIVVDSGSRDNTLDIVSRYPVRLYQIPEAEFNHGLTRNLGISKAEGRFIILLTQDAVPYDDQWMRGLVDNFKNDDHLAGVYSRQLPHQDSGALTKFLVQRFFTSETERRESRIARAEDYSRLTPCQKHRFCNFDNVSSCIRKSIWQKVPFAKTDFGEDLEWSKKVLEAGYGIVYDPKSKVCHAHDFSFSGWYRRNLINHKKLHSLFGVKN